MKTAEDIILEIQELPPEERRKVDEFVFSSREDEFKPTQYDDATLQMLAREAELSKQRTDTQESSSADELCKTLGLQ